MNGMEGGGEGGRTAVQVDHDFEAGASGPADGVVEDGELALHVRVAVEGGDGPVADGDADVVQAGGGDLVEVVLGDPGVPVVGETRGRFVFSESGGVGVLVDDGLGFSPVAEDGRRDPWLQDEPAA